MGARRRQNNSERRGKFRFFFSLSRHGYEVFHEEKSNENTTRRCTRKKAEGSGIRCEEEETEIVFRSSAPPTDPPTPVPLSPPDSPNTSAELQYKVVLDMVQKINSELGLINLDNDKIKSVCDQLLKDNKARDRAIGDLTGLVKKCLDCPVDHRPQHDDLAPHPIIQQDLIDNEGNLRAADIGITWEGSENFLHGVSVVGPSAAELPGRPRQSTSTPYQPVREHIECGMSTPRQPLVQPTCLGTPDTPLRRNNQEGRQGYRPAASIQRFNNKLLNWSSWFRHFKVVADVHGWIRARELCSWCHIWMRL